MTPDKDEKINQCERFEASRRPVEVSVMAWRGAAKVLVYQYASILMLALRGRRDSVEDAAAVIQAQIYREWGVAIVKGRAEYWLCWSVLCRTRRRGPRSPAGSRGDKLIERANVAHCSGGVAEAVLLRRRYAVMKEAARARRR